MKKDLTMRWVVVGVVGITVLVLGFLSWQFYNAYRAAQDDAKRASVDAALIKIPQPPQDDSEDTRADLAALKEYKAERSQEVLDAIALEASIDNVLFGEQTVAQYRDKTAYPKLSRVFLYSFDEFERVLKLKQQEFNRTRPSVLDASIEPIVAVPSTPGYPAGGTARGRFVAHVLAYVDPAHKEAYLGRAEEMGYHQAVAGLQFVLDNAVGSMLGEWFFTLLTKDPEFMKRLDAAKIEWTSMH